MYIILMKEKIVSFLHDLIKFVAARHEPGYQFKLAQYRKAIMAVQQYPNDITNKNKLKQALLTQFKNPATILKKIENFMNKSKTENLSQKINTTREDVIADLTKVVGIGPVKAASFFNTHGIKSVRNLKMRTDILTKQQN